MWRLLLMSISRHVSAISGIFSLRPLGRPKVMSSSSSLSKIHISLSRNTKMIFHKLIRSTHNCLLWILLKIDWQAKLIIFLRIRLGSIWWWLNLLLGKLRGGWRFLLVTRYINDVWLVGLYLLGLLLFGLFFWFHVFIYKNSIDVFYK